MSMVAAQEQGMGSSKDQRHNRHRYPLVEAHLLSIKGKRTKRPRPASPARITTALTMSSVSPSASACYNSGTHDEAAAAGATRPVTTTTAASSTTTASADQYPSQISGGSTTAIDEEEEDMAYCLILLAQGDRNKENNNNTSTQRSNDSRHQRQPTAEVPVTFPKETSTAVMESGSIRTKTSSSSVPPAAAASSSSAYAAYECKTCNRCFPSFQALGGHRASHKRPKQTPPDPLERKQLNISSPFSDHDGVLNDDGSSLSLQIGITASCNNRYHDGIITTTTTTPPYNKSKVHECSICGAVFSSGQALGGHMRRHRTLLSGGGVGGGASAVAANPVSSAAPTMIGGRRIDENIKEAVEDHEDVKRTRTLLSLDLNLPAPEDDHRGDHHHHHQQQQQPSKFVFSSNDRTLLLSASSLVDCHY